MAIEYVAVDFETANEQRVSACSIGIAVFEDGRVRTFERLLRPPEMRFEPFHVSIHGITAEMVADAPTFAELWPELRELLGGSHEVFAHWAPFDKGVLKACFAHYQIPDPVPVVSCTCKLARVALPGLESYSLDAVADALQIDFSHHEAGSDAYACAEIVRSLRLTTPDRLAAQGTKFGPAAHPLTEPLVAPADDELLGVCEGILIDGIVTIAEVRGLVEWLEEHPRFTRNWPGDSILSRSREVLSDGSLSDEEASMIETLLRSSVSGIPQPEPKSADAAGFDELPPATVLSGKSLCFTGEFAFGTREECQRATVEAGGKAAANVSKKLDFLVIGTMAGDAWFSGKVEKATACKLAGAPLRIISEASWVKALRG